MAYTVIARRYRSQTFDDVVGQDAVAQTLKNAIEMERVAHAYLFCGTRGVGKTTMARILAKSLNCLQADGPTVKPCLKCDSCVSINVGEDIDVIEIDGASNTGVDNIRQLRENAIYRPARARFKIYIIDEVHMLSTGAFNALLKILEEPPDHVKFIFATTEPNKVLATIQSRCQRFDFKNIGAETIGRQLEVILKEEKITYEKDLIVMLSRLANGSMRDALSLLDQLISAGQQPLTAEQLNTMVGIPDRQKVLNLLTAIAEHNGAGIIESIEQLIDSGQSAGQICDLLIDNMRDLMVFRAAGADNRVLVLTEEEKKQISAIAAQFDVAALVYNITALEKLRWTLRTSETSRALLEASLLRLGLSDHFIGLDQLSRRIAGGAVGGVKKKLTADSPGGMDETVSNVQAFSGSVGTDLGSMAAGWDRLAAQCGQADPTVGNFLMQGRPAAFLNSTLTICFSENGQGQLAKSMCERKADKIAGRLSDLLGTKLTVKFETGPSVGNSVPAAARAETSEPEKTPRTEEAPPVAVSEPRRVNKEERAAVLNDPAVQIVLKGLDARPVEVQKIELDEASGIEPEETTEQVDKSTEYGFPLDGE